MFARLSKFEIGGPSLPLGVFVVVLVLGPQSLWAVASGVTESVHACTQEPDDVKRLACYDNAAGRAQSPAVAINQPTAAPKTLERPVAQTPAAPPKAAEITASITHITRRADGRYVMTLDNGQIWSEVETKERFSVNKGDTVTIRSELLGAHYLRTPLGADVRVVHQP
jgi:hypothetical protein